MAHFIGRITRPDPSNNSFQIECRNSTEITFRHIPTDIFNQIQVQWYRNESTEWESHGGVDLEILPAKFIQIGEKNDESNGSSGEGEDEEGGQASLYGSSQHCPVM